MPALDLIRVHSRDNVAVALRPLTAGETLTLSDGTVLTLREPVAAGHKVALGEFACGAPVIKFGFKIGHATTAIACGAWVHSHNLESDLGGDLEYSYCPAAGLPTPSNLALPATFRGYRRADGRVGTRNEVWILNTVGCVNPAAARIAEQARARFGAAVDGIHAWGHPFGCSQLGDDLENTRRILAGLIRHPNAGGVLVLGLGCENNRLDALCQQVGNLPPERLRSFNLQEVEDEIAVGVEQVGELVAVLSQDRREPCSLADLVLGLKCGGSDGFSGITANPLVGRVADQVLAAGGSAILTEVPEMFGAEHLLMQRAVNAEVFAQIVALIHDFKQYFRHHQQPIDENPSPGNREGGITTLEEKSLGAIQKGGSSPVQRVLRYGDPTGVGLALLEAPGNDGVSSTAMVASGATLLLFTTGRGTPMGFPVPTLKIASNSALAAKKPRWIDFDAGRLLHGAAPEPLAAELLAQVVAVASGELTRNEQEGYREIAIWKSGVTL